jgi:N-acetylmuramoyl-L-alanine amidase
MPAVLIELLFISNPAEEARLSSEDYQNKAALAIAKGIGDYFGINIVSPAAQQPVSQTQLADLQRPKIHVGGTTLEGIIIDGRTYAPVRALGEAIGHQVTWDDSTSSVIIR